MNRDALGPDRWLRFLAMLVPGLTAGTTWPATEGLPWLHRVAIAIAAGITLYAVIHYAVRVSLRDRNR